MCPFDDSDKIILKTFSAWSVGEMGKYTVPTTYYDYECTTIIN